MEHRTLCRNGPLVSVIGYGAFKSGRNTQTKYGVEYSLPDDATVTRFFNEVLDLGITFIDTAPSYGLSDERIGRAISHRQDEFVLSTKVGECFENGRSTYDFSESAIERSIEESLRRLKRDFVDVVFIHAHGEDRTILEQSDAVPTLQKLKGRGRMRFIGHSAKTVDGARMALQWADVLMLEYHLADQSMRDIILQAETLGVGVVVKKSLASGTLPAAETLRFVLRNPSVSSAVVSTLSLQHLRENIRAVESI